MSHSVWKLPKISHFNFSISAFSINFCPTESDLSINSVWLFQVFKNSQKWTIFGIFYELLSTLRSQCWMRLFLWFSNIVCLKSLELFWGYLLVYVRDYYKILQMKKQLVLASLWYFRMNALQRLILAPKFIYPKSDFLNFFLNFSRKNSKIFFQNSKKLPNLT